MSQSGLGRVFNVIFTSSTVSVPLTAGTAVTFIHSQAGTGTATLTLTQTIAGASSVALNVGTQTAGQENLGSLQYVGPDDGATAWVAKAATSANVFTLGGATNDTGCVTVRAEQLADGYNCVVGTASAGSLVAIVHDLLVQRKPSNLKPVATV